MFVVFIVALNARRARNVVVPAPGEDPWTHYCMAYIHAGRLFASCGRKEAARIASERFGVRISQHTARRAAMSGGPPTKRGAQLSIPRDVETKVEDLCLFLRELKLPIFRFMVLNYMNVLVAGTDIADRLRHKEVRRHWYCKWLGRCERLKTAKITPLEMKGRSGPLRRMQRSTTTCLQASLCKRSWRCLTRRTTHRVRTRSA